jgi:hypothetical protein
VLLDIYIEDGLFKCDLDEHTTLVNIDKSVLEDQLDLLENLQRISRLPRDTT